MKLLILILFLSTTAYGQDSVSLKVIKTSEKVIVFKDLKTKFRYISVDCDCKYKKGDVIRISKQRMDSLIINKPFRKQDL